MDAPIFILIRNVQGKVITNKEAIELEVERGSLLREVRGTPRERDEIRKMFHVRNTVFHHSSQLFLETYDYRNVVTACSSSDVEIISTKYADFLAACPDVQKRYELFRRPNFLHTVARLRVDDEISIFTEHGSEKGRIRWIGRAYPSKSSTFFGVQLKSGRGETDGEFDGRKFFDAPPKSAVFVSVERLDVKSGDERIVPIQIEQNLKRDINSNVLKIKLKNPKRDDSENCSPPPPVIVDDRVVWPRDDGSAESGNIRWVGHLPTFTGWVVGVEFDNAVGNGAGQYNGRRLFKTEMNHAALLPVDGLVKYDDYVKSQQEFPLHVVSQEGSGAKREVAGEIKEEFKGKVEVSDKKPPPPAAQDVQIGSCVEFDVLGQIKFGVVRWIGEINGRKSIGVELDEDLRGGADLTCDGSSDGIRHFRCHPSRGLFLPAADVRLDSRFDDIGQSGSGGKSFGALDGGVIKNYVAPIDAARLGADLCGRPKGIQGHKNSCYLDSTLFAMFAGSEAFDMMILRPKRKGDVADYIEIQDLLKFEIVFPLRRACYVRADHVVHLRELLSKTLIEVKGLTEEEKDPEELLNGLLGGVFRAQPDVVLTSGQTSHLCQLIVGEWDGKRSSVVNVQTLLERSFFHSDISLKQIPTRFIVQIPRYGKEKVLQWIVPNLSLDISYVLENNPKMCSRCEAAASLQCQECFLTGVESLAETFFCPRCFARFHDSLTTKEKDHAFKKVATISVDEATLRQRSKVQLELSAVLCIESSHYVSYARIGRGAEASWVFFDSMADREGLDDGYNVPEVTVCENMINWLSAQNYGHLVRDLEESADAGVKDSRRKELPPYLKRLLKDCYICFYVWNDGLMFH